MRKVYVNLTVRLVLNMDEGVEVKEVVDGLNYEITTDPMETRVDLLDTEIKDFEVADSK